MASVSFHSRLAAPSEPVDVQGAKQRLRGKQEAPSYNEGLPKEFLVWRGQQVYVAYKNLGGAQPLEELADTLALAEPNPVRYAERMGVAMDGRLAAERQPPRACLGLLVQEWGAELTVAQWKLQREEALADDPLEAGLAALEKIEERPLVNKAEKKAKAAAAKKPSAAPHGSTHKCVGRGLWPCIYNLQQPGARGRYDSSDAAQSRKCLFCDSGRLAKACGNSRGRSHVLGNLKKFRAVYEVKPHVYNSALLRIPDACRDELHEKAVADARPQAVVRRERRAQQKAPPAQKAKTSWAAALALRKRAWRPLTAAEAKKHKKQVKADRKRAQKKFFEAHDIEVPTAEDIADNDAGLPGPGLSEQGRFVELWAKFGSWGVCEECRSLQPRRLEPIDCRRVAKPEIASRACKACQNGKVAIPKFEDIPQPLRALSKDVVKTLRPLDIDAGPYRRAAYGYRVHTAMIRLAWAAESVADKIQQLPRDERTTARAAYKFLMDSEESAYQDFIKEHDKFLRRQGKEEASEQRRKRPLQFLETPGLENALWPNLYWNEAMCETSVRASDVRRRRRRNAADPAQEVGGPRPESRGEPRARRPAAEDSGSEEEGEDSGRQSIKKSFMKKVLGPIAGYAEDFDLLQFVYDLSLWSRIGGGKNACKHIPLRLVLKGETFSPLYFKTRHAALIDLQRQCGHPQIFKTMAPWEPSFPYHFWILNEMAQAGRRRGGSTAEGEPEQELAGLETLHHAHVFTELERGLYTGMNKRSSADGGEKIVKGEFKDLFFLLFFLQQQHNKQKTQSRTTSKQNK